MPDGAVNTNQVATLAVDDGVQRHRGLARLAVANDQLALAAADGNHRVDGLQSGRHRLSHRLAIDDAGCQSLHIDALISVDRALVIDRVAERVYHAADHGIADGHAHDAAGTLDLVALFDLGVLAHEHHAHLVFFQVHSKAVDIVREGEQLARHDLVEAVDARDAVADGHDRADFVDRDLRFVVVDLLAYELGDLVCFDLRHNFQSGRAGLQASVHAFSNLCHPERRFAALLGVILSEASAFLPGVILSERLQPRVEGPLYHPLRSYYQSCHPDRGLQSDRGICGYPALSSCRIFSSCPRTEPS